MEPIGRRSLIVGTAAAVAALRLRNAGLPLPAAAQAPGLVDDPFALGVATGDPSADGFVAWTRLAPAPTTTGGGMPPGPVAVAWEVASDPGFASVVLSGSTTATADLGHTVHVTVEGLDPDGEWWVRFAAEGFDSPVARARTLPAAGTTPLRFAFASCQSYPSGYYTALRHLADEQVDLWLHLGDYIYENGGSGAGRDHPPGECFTLDDYRNRYGLYKADADLQAAHQSAPVVPVWDDHEVDNNYADEEGDGGPAQVLARRTAGYRAWFEHQPVRLAAPAGPDLPIFRRLRWGDLATFHMVDGRQYRDPAPCGGGVTDCPDRAGVDRDMLGAEQRGWLADGLAASTTTWDVLGNQTVFVPMPIAGLYNTDQWDGYPQDRERVWAALRQRPNPVVVTGDIHAAGVARLHQTLDDESTERIGTELVGPSVSSRPDPRLATPAVADLVRGIPWVDYVNVADRGYVLVELTAEALHAEYRMVGDASAPGGTVRTDHVVDVAARSATAPPEEPPPPSEEPPPTAPPAEPISTAADFTG